jgi:hypothetical protein
MPAKLSNKYNPYAREAMDELFLLDEDFDQFENPVSTISRTTAYMN